MDVVFFMFTTIPFSPVNRMWQVSFFMQKNQRKRSGFPKINSGISARTLRELKQALKDMNADMSNSYREDH